MHLGPRVKKRGGGGGGGQLKIAHVITGTRMNFLNYRPITADTKIDLIGGNVTVDSALLYYPLS